MIGWVLAIIFAVGCAYLLWDRKESDAAWSRDYHEIERGLELLRKRVRELEGGDTRG